MRFKTATLGCKVNQYETQFLRTAFVANGWEAVDDAASSNDVDLVLVNTCSVTAESDAKSRKTVSHFAKLYPNAEIVVLGCFAASSPTVAASLPNVSEVVSDKRRLVDFLRRRSFETIPTGVDGFAERRRAYVKIQDGCRVGCAYCIIPSTRPYLQSRRPDEILAEARTLVAAGYREIVLTGIHLGHYGVDFYRATPESLPPVPDAAPLDAYLERWNRVPIEERTDLGALLRILVDAELPVRWRLGSLEAVEVCDKTLRVFEERPDVLCPQFHLSMQSGDDDVLAAMRRRWSSAPFIEKCREIRRRIPDAALTTDVIVGFPGETNAQFERTCDVVRELEFSRVHVFRFSPRAGTVAAGLPNQIAPEVKKERAARLQQIANDLRERFAERFVGKTARVLVEEIERRPDGRIVATGTTDRYFNVEIPLNDAASTSALNLLNADVSDNPAQQNASLALAAASPRSESLESANGVSLGDVLDVRLTSRRGDALSGVLERR
ncbi:MAG: MiaB/RimO family radical SAM methylthiotransferase [Thermoguttaceae bacterium]|nr:MiaB/RimO family radical SAM methylthiotransferase [Thermoguttaceae bacterium]